MNNEKFYVFDVENNNYKTFDNYYRLLCFLERAPYSSFGNAKTDKRWQQKRVSIWEMLRTKNYSNPISLKNILYVAYDVFMNVVDCKKLEKFLAENSDRVPFIIITITNNTAGGQPVSMKNLRDVRAISKKYHKPVLFDSARFAENAYFIEFGK